MAERRANLQDAPRAYTLKGHKTSITFTFIPPGFATPGLPIQSRLEYQGEEGGTKTFTGNQLQIQKTHIGTQVSVTLSIFADAPTEYLTLLLPDIAGNVDGQSFTTLALLTEDLTPAFIVHKEGALQYYEVIPLFGTVKNIVVPLSPPSSS